MEEMMKEQQQQQQQQQERTTSRPMLPTEFIASAYLRRRRKEIAFSLRRKFRRHNDKNDMMEAQESLIPLGVFDEKFTDEVQNEENKRKDDTIWCGLSLSTRLILIAAIVSLVVNMIVMFGMDLYTSSIAGALVACMVGVAQLRLEDLETLRQVHNRIREDVNRLCMENIHLGSNVNDLTMEVQRLSNMEGTLQEIATKQDSNSENLVDLVRENRITMNEMRHVLRNDIIAELMAAVFRGEREDESKDEFSELEIQRFLQFMHSLPAVTINEELLLKAIEKDRSITSLLKLIQDIGIVGVQEGDTIFIINEEDRELQTRFLEETP